MKYTKNKKLFILLTTGLLFVSSFLFQAKIKPLKASAPLSERLKGRILIQPEAHGEAWYVSPVNHQRYFLNRPQNAFQIMQEHGIGVTDSDLNKIPVGLIDYNDKDDDNDGLPNRLETALRTDPNKTDTDGDGYNDYDEILNNYNPLGFNNLDFDKDFFTKHSGEIFLHISNHGEAWYLDPLSKKRYYLGLPADAFIIMGKFGLGITNENIKQIPIGTQSPKPSPPLTPVPNSIKYNSPGQLMSTASKAIRQNNLTLALSTFTTDMHQSIKYTMNFLDNEQKLLLGNILAGTQSKKSTEILTIFSTEIYFNGKKHQIDFYVKKQNDGGWLLTNL